MWFDEIMEHTNCYRYHEIGHFWRDGAEQWRQLVYMIGTIREKYRFLGEEVCNDQEMEIMSLIEFAPFYYYFPINEDPEEWYDKTEEGFCILYTSEQGLDFRIEQNGGNLSGGQKQRLTIARALVRKPEILILDDSASALDFATDARLRKAIKENTENMTVFLVSQRVSTIRNADHILVLDDGKIAGIGTHLQLLKENQVYKEICESQMAGEEA